MSSVKEIERRVGALVEKLPPCRKRWSGCSMGAGGRRPPSGRDC
jgi:hypothetical protein